MTKASTDLSEDVADVVDTFVPDPQVWKELGISSMTGWRWQRDPDLNFPPRIQIRGRNFRSRKQLERWKARCCAGRSESAGPPQRGRGKNDLSNSAAHQPR